MSEDQRCSLGFLLYKLETSSIKDLRQQAYVIATIKHETANTYEPVKEFGSEMYLRARPYYPYIGRGYVQLTWKDNYKRFGDLLKIDLLTNPSLAQNKPIAWKITELGMTKGLFTGKKLDDYFNVDDTDWINARRIINRLDRAELIAGYAKKIYHTITRIEPVPPAKTFDPPS